MTDEIARLELRWRCYAKLREWMNIKDYCTTKPAQVLSILLGYEDFGEFNIHGPTEDDLRRMHLLLSDNGYAVFKALEARYL